jgi:hypothetical protein
MQLLLLEVVLPLLFLGLTTGKKSEVDHRTHFRLLVAAGREGPSLGLVALPFSAWCLEAASPACGSGIRVPLVLFVMCAFHFGWGRFAYGFLATASLGIDHDQRYLFYRISYKMVHHIGRVALSRSSRVALQ